jgi:hypothetical protein
MVRRIIFAQDRDADEQVGRPAQVHPTIEAGQAVPLAKTARAAVMSAVAAIDTDMRRMTRASAACRRLMTIPGVGQLTALAFVAAIDDPSRIRRSRDVGEYLGLVPRRYQSGEVDYVGGISKCGDRRVRTLLYEAGNVVLTRYKGPAQAEGLGLRHRQAINHAQGAYRSGASSRDHHACNAARRNRVRSGVGLTITEIGDRIQLPQGATPEGGSRRRRRLCRTRLAQPTAFST